MGNPLPNFRIAGAVSVFRVWNVSFVANKGNKVLKMMITGFWEKGDLYVSFCFQ
jgi:hypothetical protein